MAEELLEKIPPEKCWEITARILWRFITLRGDKLVAPELGKGMDIISPLWSKEKWFEIVEKGFGTEAGKKFMPWVKETFNIPVEDAIGAAKLLIVCGTLFLGPEQEIEIVEATPERVLCRCPKCLSWEIYNECEVDPAYRPCDVSVQAFCEEGFKEINPKITYMASKARPRGDPYCEYVFEFKEK